LAYTIITENITGICFSGPFSNARNFSRWQSLILSMAITLKGYLKRLDENFCFKAEIEKFRKKDESFNFLF